MMPTRIQRITRIMSQNAAATNDYHFDLIRNVAATCCKQFSMLYKYKNHFLSTKRSTMLLLLLLLFTQTTLAVRVADKNEAVTVKNVVTKRECGRMEVLNKCDSFLQLQGCTVIKGYLKITLLNATLETCDYTKYTFPDLREITEYLMFYKVDGLTSIRDMFPKLTVIRGNRLFLNYALGISTMPDIEVLEFRSLIAIQRGHVFIGSCPRLCQLEKINWDRLTIGSGENHINPIPSNTCTAKECRGCPYREYCWSNTTCQRFENDKVLIPQQDKIHCHEQCLGGCYNQTKEGCWVCRNLTDHGACVKECPSDKYLHELHQRCYTKEECTHVYELYTHGGRCLAECPAGFIANNTNFSCIPCAQNQTCTRNCQPPSDGAFDQQGVFLIFNLGDADRLSGCQVLNGTLLITIRNKVRETDLQRSLASIEEIKGHLKIVRSPHLTSLMFLQNLKKISGEPLESDLYAIILYDNKNLSELWNGKNLKLSHGSLFIHSNNKLCNRYLKEFRDSVVHDNAKDSLQINDQEVLCDPASLTLNIEVISSDTLSFTWRINQTSDEIEILYKPVMPNQNFDEESEFDSDVCHRINWERRLMLKSALQGNTTHYSLNITGLQQFTQYACLLRTFGNEESMNARSLMKMPCTTADKPTPPLLVVKNTTETSLTIQLVPQNISRELIDYYNLEVYEHPYDKRLLDKRNFCEQPSKIYYLDIPPKVYASSKYNEDYDNCCARQEEANQDRYFMHGMRKKYACKQNAVENCVQHNTPTAPFHNLHLRSNETIYRLPELKLYSSYTLQLWACNNVVGCGSYTLLNVHTNYSMEADKLKNLQACRVPGNTEYRISFAEPTHPNGQIVSYVIHFRNYDPAAKADQYQLRCITRREHEAANYSYIEKLNVTFNEVAVRVHSLAGDVFTDWVKVSKCDGHKTKLAGIGGSTTTEGGDSHGVNIFLICFLLGAGGTLLWICYKRRYWRILPEWRRYSPLHCYWRATSLRRDNDIEDRQILVDSFETVRFHNNPDDDY